MLNAAPAEHPCLHDPSSSRQNTTAHARRLRLARRIFRYWCQLIRSNFACEYFIRIIITWWLEAFVTAVEGCYSFFSHSLQYELPNRYHSKGYPRKSTPGKGRGDHTTPKHAVHTTPEGTCHHLPGQTMHYPPIFSAGNGFHASYIP